MLTCLILKSKIRDNLGQIRQSGCKTFLAHVFGDLFAYFLLLVSKTFYTFLSWKDSQ